MSVVIQRCLCLNFKQNLFQPLFHTTNTVFPDMAIRDKKPQIFHPEPEEPSKIPASKRVTLAGEPRIHSVEMHNLTPEIYAKWKLESSSKKISRTWVKLSGFY